MQFFGVTKPSNKQDNKMISEGCGRRFFCCNFKFYHGVCAGEMQKKKP
jgi:hypothetical protein